MAGIRQFVYIVFFFLARSNTRFSIFPNIHQNHVKSDLGNQVQFVQWFFFPMYKSNGFGGGNDFLMLNLKSQISLNPPNHWIYTWEKKTTVQIEVGSQDQILHGFDRYL